MESPIDELRKLAIERDLACDVFVQYAESSATPNQRLYNATKALNCRAESLSYARALRIIEPVVVRLQKRISYLEAQLDSQTPTFVASEYYEEIRGQHFDEYL